MKIRVKLHDPELEKNLAKDYRCDSEDLDHSNSTSGGPASEELATKPESSSPKSPGGKKRPTLRRKLSKPKNLMAMLASGQEEAAQQGADEEEKSKGEQQKKRPTLIRRLSKPKNLMALMAADGAENEKPANDDQSKGEKTEKKRPTLRRRLSKPKNLMALLSANEDPTEVSEPSVATEQTQQSSEARRGRAKNSMGMTRSRSLGRISRAATRALEPQPQGEPTATNQTTNEKKVKKKKKKPTSSQFPSTTTKKEAKPVIGEGKPVDSIAKLQSRPQTSLRALNDLDKLKQMDDRLSHLALSPRLNGPRRASVGNSLYNIPHGAADSKYRSLDDVFSAYDKIVDDAEVDLSVNGDVGW